MHIYILHVLNSRTHAQACVNGILEELSLSPTDGVGGLSPSGKSELLQQLQRGSGWGKASGGEGVGAVSKKYVGNKNGGSGRESREGKVEANGRYCV